MPKTEEGIDLEKCSFRNFRSSVTLILILTLDQVIGRWPENQEEPAAVVVDVCTVHERNAEVAYNGKWLSVLCKQSSFPRV